MTYFKSNRNLRSKGFEGASQAPAQVYAAITPVLYMPMPTTNIHGRITGGKPPGSLPPNLRYDNIYRILNVHDTQRLDWGLNLRSIQ